MLEVLSHHRMPFSPMQNSNEPQDSRRLPPIATQLPDIFRDKSRLAFPVTPDSANEAKKVSPVKRKREESGSGDERPTQKRQMTAQSPVDSRRSLSGSWQPYPPRHSNAPSPAQPNRVISPSSRSEPSRDEGLGHVRLPSINPQPPASAGKSGLGSSHTSPHVSPLTRKAPTSTPNPKSPPPPREPLPPLIDPNRGSNPISLPPLRDLAREPPPYRSTEPTLPPTTLSGDTKYHSAYDSRPYRPSDEHRPPPPPPPPPPHGLSTSTRRSPPAAPLPSNPGQSPVTDRFYPTERPSPYGTSSDSHGPHSYDSRAPPSSRYSEYGSGPAPPPPPPAARPSEGYGGGLPPASRGYDRYNAGPPPPPLHEQPEYGRPPHQPAPPPHHHTHSHSHGQAPQPPPPAAHHHHHQPPPHMPYSGPYSQAPVHAHGSSMNRTGEQGTLRTAMYTSPVGGAGQFSWEVGGVSDPYNRKRRGNLPKESTAILNAWFLQHIDHPYPKEEEKQSLQTQTGLTMSQISNWFINARRRRRPTALRRDPVPGGSLDWER